MSEHQIEIVSCKRDYPTYTSLGIYPDDVGEAIIDGVSVQFRMNYNRNVPILTFDNKGVRKHPDYRKIRDAFWHTLQWYKSENS